MSWWLIVMLLLVSNLLFALRLFGFLGWISYRQLSLELGFKMLKNLFGFLGDIKDLAAPPLEEGQPQGSQRNANQPKPLRQPSVSRRSKSSKASAAATLSPVKRESTPTKLVSGAAFEDVEVLIRAAYKQVFGNVHLMDSQRLLTAESRLKDGQFTAKEFVRALAKSDLYRALFLEKFSNVRVVELNFQHFLGRPPESAQEISEHIAILVNQGFEAEIDSYLDSDEYARNFGERLVPYYVSYSTQVGKSVAGYNRIAQLVKGASSSDRAMTASGQSQLQSELLAPVAYPPQPIVFAPKALKVAKSLGAKPKSPKKAKATEAPVADGSSVQVKIFPEDQAKTSADRYRDAYAGNAIVEFYGDTASQENLDIIIRSAYRQVFGNAYLMDSERSPIAESQLRSGRITVLDFIRQLAKSDRYRTLFWDKYPPVTAIELNFKHLLGRAPNAAEISQHLHILAEGGFEAEIDSYLDSDEYFQTFGTIQVPYPRGYNTQSGVNAVGFTRAFPLLGPACSSDKSTFGNARPILQASLLADEPGQVPAIRAIPESFPAELSKLPAPRIPAELRSMARQLLQKEGGYQRYRVSAAFMQSAFANDD